LGQTKMRVAFVIKSARNLEEVAKVEERTPIMVDAAVRWHSPWLSVDLKCKRLPSRGDGWIF